MKPPFVHNGFLAEVEFPLLERKEEKMTKTLEDPFPKKHQKESLISFDTEDFRSSVIQHDEAVLTYIRPEIVIEQVTRPSQLPHSLAMPNDSPISQCRDEITELHRSGLMSSSLLLQNYDTCSIVFRGGERDLVLIRINSLQLR